MPDNFDFIAIGDIVTDAFIKLSDAHVHENMREHSRELCLRYGDKVPYESVTLTPAVGNSPNAAVAAAKLGLKSALVTNIGADDFGHEDLEALNAAGVATGFVKTQEGKASNYHFVLWYKSERTILIRHEAFTYALPEIGEPKWIYLSSAGKDSLPFHEVVADYLDAHPNIQLAFQPGTFQMQAGYQKMQRLYKRSSILFCNKEEAQRILETKEGDPKKLLIMMHDRGPKSVVITDGPKGLYASDLENAWFMPPYPDPAPPYERTGAGDACSSTITAAIALGQPFEKAITWGPVNSAYVVQKIGAQAGLLTRAELEGYLAITPADYKPQNL